MTNVPGSRGEHIVVGAIWRHKRDRTRTVTITYITDHFVYVDRNTSRRKQPLTAATLIRDYVCKTTNSPFS